MRDFFSRSARASDAIASMDGSSTTVEGRRREITLALSEKEEEKKERV